MKLFDAYSQALDEDDDVLERDEFSNDPQIKQCVLDEIMNAMIEIRDAKAEGKSKIELVQPMFRCVAFWFIIGIRVGKILRDQELAGK